MNGCHMSGLEEQPAAPAPTPASTPAKAAAKPADFGGPSGTLNQAALPTVNVSPTLEAQEVKNPTSASKSRILSRGLVCYILMEFRGYTFVTLACYTLLLEILLGVMYVRGRKYSGAVMVRESDESSNSKQAAKAFLTREQIVPYIDDFVSTLNGLLSFLERFLLCEDLILLAKVIVSILVLAMLGRVLDGTKLFIMLHVSLFTFPTFLAKNKAWVDRNVWSVIGLGEEVSPKAEFGHEHLKAD